MGQVSASVLAKMASPKGEPGFQWGRGAGVAFALAAQAQFLDEGLVTFEVRSLQVCQQLTAFCSHQEQTPAGVKVLPVGLQVLGQVSNAMREQGDLYFSGPGVFLVGSVILDYTLLVDVFGHG